ncbi:hypothetical protein BS47DRAFT_1335952 [Hydnum rufescens UP504]|uniref:Uncharacterized protein n=1 Tax=Hydnum rufescens UP504 TaxID=1448309 RepID=A0A9P6BAB3_9AGAM|nr:hypothetical protein BS47DRAFT_1335952 [Hydnum rufescens UP504]
MASGAPATVAEAPPHACLCRTQRLIAIAPSDRLPRALIHLPSLSSQTVSRPLARSSTVFPLPLAHQYLTWHRMRSASEDQRGLLYHSKGQKVYYKIILFVMTFATVQIGPSPFVLPPKDPSLSKGDQGLPLTRPAYKLAPPALSYRICSQ